MCLGRREKRDKKKRIWRRRFTGINLAFLFLVVKNFVRKGTGCGRGGGQENRRGLGVDLGANILEKEEGKSLMG